MAHLERLEGLRFDSLGYVQDHHGCVGGGEDSVGVLGEVTVARGVRAELTVLIAIPELEHGGADRYPPLLLQSHPGRGQLSLRPARADRPGFLDGSGVEQELPRSARGLAGDSGWLMMANVRLRVASVEEAASRARSKGAVIGVVLSILPPGNPPWPALRPGYVEGYRHTVSSAERVPRRRASSTLRAR